MAKRTAKTEAMNCPAIQRIVDRMVDGPEATITHTRPRQGRSPRASTSILLAAIAGCCFVLAACGARGESASAPAASATPIPVSPPTSTPSLLPTPSPEPEQEIATGALPTATPVPPATPTLPATPTPQTDQRMESARRFLRYGDYPAARSQLMPLVTGEIPAAGRAQGLFLLARSYLAEGLYREALTSLESLDTLAQTVPGLPAGLAANGHYLRGEAHLGLNQPGPAVGAYWQFLEAYPWMSEAVQPRIAAAYLAMGDVESAALAYSRADEVIARYPEETATRARNLERKAQSLSDYGYFAAAAAAYDEILTFAQKAEYRTEILYRAGQALAAAGDQSAAIERWRAATTEAPASGHAYLALIELVNLQVDFDLYLRGYIDQMAGAWLPAINAYQAYLDIVDASDNRAPLAMLGLGQSYLGAENYQAAIDTFDQLLAAYPECPCRGEAWLDKARARAGQGDIVGANRTYRTFAREYPADPSAPEALWRSGWLALNAGNQLEAAIDFLNLADSFPESERAPTGLYIVGLGAFRQGLYGQAAGMLSRLQNDYPEFRRPDVGYWLGRASQADGEPANASAQWQTLQERTPDIYYGILADLALKDVDLSQGSMITNIGAAIGPRSTLEGDTGEQAFAEAWLQEWIDPTDDSSPLGELPAPIAQDNDLQMGRLLLELGERGQALDFLERLYRRYRSDPHALFALSLEFERLGAYRLSLISAVRLLGLSPADLVEDAPIFLQERAYPRRFAELVDREADAHNLNPLLYYSLIRQESLFEEGARSVAAAQGLAQIIPDTGAWIAGAINYPNYTNDLVYRPHVNLKFGAYYLDWARTYLDGNLISALVGYNAGPGNAVRWREQSGNDDSLFVEILDYSEPRLYVRNVVGNLYHYTRLYGPLYGQ